MLHRFFQFQNRGAQKIAQNLFLFTRISRPQSTNYNRIYTWLKGRRRHKKWLILHFQIYFHSQNLVTVCFFIVEWTKSSIFRCIFCYAFVQWAHTNARTHIFVYPLTHLIFVTILHKLKWWFSSYFARAIYMYVRVVRFLQILKLFVGPCIRSYV